MKKEESKTLTFHLSAKDLEEKYPLDEPQLAQIDCRIETCFYYKGAGVCFNVAPALTLNPDKSFVCWSKKDKQTNSVKEKAKP